LLLRSNVFWSITRFSSSTLFNAFEISNSSVLMCEERSFPSLDFTSFATVSLSISSRSSRFRSRKACNSSSF
jgi:hypothetical protein